MCHYDHVSLETDMPPCLWHLTSMCTRCMVPYWAMTTSNALSRTWITIPLSCTSPSTWGWSGMGRLCWAGQERKSDCVTLQGIYTFTKAAMKSSLLAVWMRETRGSSCVSAQENRRASHLCLLCSHFPLVTVGCYGIHLLHGVLTLGTNPCTVAGHMQDM